MRSATLLLGLLLLANAAVGASRRHVGPQLADAKRTGTPQRSAISLDPALEALCRSLIGRLDTYGNPLPNVDIVSADGIVSSGSQTGCGAPQNSTAIAVNPQNPLNIVVGANDYRLFDSSAQRNESAAFAYVSFDGGRSWANIPLPKQTGVAGAVGALSVMDAAVQPAIAFGPGNVVYYASMVLSRTSETSGIIVAKSLDGGRTWSEPTIVRIDGVTSSGKLTATRHRNERPGIVVGPETGVVYVTWTRLGPEDSGVDASPIVVARSVDGGRSWSKFVTVNSALAFRAGSVTPFSHGSTPQVGAGGELHIAYLAAVCGTLACDGASDHDAIVVATSFDGGRTFVSSEVAPVFGFPVNEDLGVSTLTGEHFAVQSFPSFAIDAVTGKLYLAWADDRGSYNSSGISVKTNGDIFVAGSFDGFHWSPPRVLGSLDDEFFPAIAAFNGRVAVAFYTRRHDPHGIGLDVATITASDLSGLNGLAHAAARRITNETSNPQIQFVAAGIVSGRMLEGVFIGDRIALALGSDGMLHPVWTDFRGRPGATAPNQDLYTQTLRGDE